MMRYHMKFPGIFCWTVVDGIQPGTHSFHRYIITEEIRPPFQVRNLDENSCIIRITYMTSSPTASDALQSCRWGRQPFRSANKRSWSDADHLAQSTPHIHPEVNFHRNFRDFLTLFLDTDLICKLSRKMRFTDCWETSHIPFFPRR